MESVDTIEPNLLILESQLRASNKDLRNLFLSFAGGCLAGIANVLVGHPLDTLKVRMQMVELPFFKCITTMIKQEGLSAFYKGLKPPLLTVPFGYMIFMGSYEISRLMQGIGFHQQVGVYEGCIAGAWSGLITCLTVTPMELVKCKLQMEIAPQNGMQTTTMGMARNIYKIEGFKGFYKGNLITIFREVPGCAAYFGSYEYVKAIISKHYGDGHLAPLIAGGVAGFLSWVVSYPQDIVKTRIQCDTGLVKQYPGHKWFRDGGMISCTKDIWRKEGMRGFWRGFSACGLRSIISEAFTFLVYENAKKHLIHP